LTQHLVLAEILGPDLLIIVGLIALLFGGSQIPKLARSLGQASHEFRKGVHEGGNASEEPSPPAEETVTMTKAELAALIDEQVAQKSHSELPPPS
jgi:sec-independent protein translocase protein TatA